MLDIQIQNLYRILNLNLNKNINIKDNDSKYIKGINDKNTITDKTSKV